MEIQNLSALITAYADLKQRKDDLKARLSDLEKQLQAAEREAVDAMLDACESAGLNAQGFRVQVGGRNYSVSTKAYYTIKAEDKEAAFSALRGLGLDYLILQRVDDRSLTREMNEAALENGGELPEEYARLPLSAYEKTVLSSRKA